MGDPWFCYMVSLCISLSHEHQCRVLCIRTLNSPSSLQKSLAKLSKKFEIFWSSLSMAHIHGEFIVG